MATIIQDLVDESLFGIKKPWEDKGVEFKGTKVKKIPEEMNFALKAFVDAEQLLRPEYVLVEKKIEPRQFLLRLSPPSFEGLEITMYFEPRYVGNEPGYSASVYFNLQKNKFKSSVREALGLSKSNLDKRYLTKAFTWEAVSSNKPYADTSLRHYINDLKKDLVVASRLRKDYDPNENLPSGPGTS